MSKPDETKQETRAEESRGLPVWKKILLALAALSLLVGLGMRFSGLGDGSSGDRGGAMRTQSSDGQTLVEGGDQGTAATGETEGDGLRGFAPLFVKGGFSFFIGFCLGYALRAFFKISAMVIGLFALALFGLQYAGFLTVDWAQLEQGYDWLVGHVKNEAGGFKTFITGSLPAAGLATLGLVAGFKK
jgi:uncharacterized membrane protein (Fun14 family)